MFEPTEPFPAHDRRIGKAGLLTLSTGEDTMDVLLAAGVRVVNPPKPSQPYRSSFFPDRKKPGPPTQPPAPRA